jgi:hypothetical protein
MTDSPTPLPAPVASRSEQFKADAILIAQAAAPAATAPVVAALPALTVFALAGVLAGLAVLCLVPLRAAPPSAAD